MSKRNQKQKKKKRQKKNGGPGARARRSRLMAQGQSQSQKQRAVKALLEPFDGFAGVRNSLRQIAKMTDEFAGIPVPVDGQRLIIDPSYKWAEALGNIEKSDDPDPAIKVRNHWYSKRRRCRIYVLEVDGKSEWAPDVSKPIDAEMMTMGASVAWGVEQEANALQTLAGHLPHHQFKYYLMAGMFVEKSKRSGITYLFRKLRPTVALAPALERPDRFNMLCSLCMHPIGYYEHSWAGAMCPTDDVIAHLMLMRADEHLYWKRCNQIPSHLPESGL